VCVVGRVGTGKSALLQGLLGEMRQVSGHTVFSGAVGYGESRLRAGILLNLVPQQPWIHGGTIRDNITFSAPTAEIDKARLDWVIDACCLRDDLRQMSHDLSYVYVQLGV